MSFSTLSILVTVIITSLCVIKDGFAQSRHINHAGFTPSAGVPTRAPPYQHFSVNTGPRYMEPVKATTPWPTQYQNYLYNGPEVNSDNHYESLHYTPLSSSHQQQPAAAQVQPSTVYSGYYYVQDKKPSALPPDTDLLVHPLQHTHHHHQNHNHQYMYPSPSHHYYSRPETNQVPKPHLEHLRQPLASHPPSDTYREAVALFSEVVHKLETQAGNGYRQGSSYSPISNWIATGSSLRDFPQIPQHLDRIMGPEFIRRAEKLYHKIIKEQNQQRFNLQESHSMQSGLPAAHFQSPQSHRFHVVPPYLPYKSLNGIPTSSRMDFDEEPETDALQTSASEAISVPSYDLGTEITPELSEPVQNTRTSVSPSPQEETYRTPKQLLHDSTFVEHPLTYEEYEGLIKDVALNSSFK